MKKKLLLIAVATMMMTSCGTALGSIGSALLTNVVTNSQEKTRTTTTTTNNLSSEEKPSPKEDFPSLPYKNFSCQTPEWVFNKTFFSPITGEEGWHMVKQENKTIKGTFFTKKTYEKEVGDGNLLIYTTYFDSDGGFFTAKNHHLDDGIGIKDYVGSFRVYEDNFLIEGDYTKGLFRMRYPTGAIIYGTFSLKDEGIIFEIDYKHPPVGGTILTYNTGNGPRWQTPVHRPIIPNKEKIIGYGPDDCIVFPDNPTVSYKIAPRNHWGHPLFGSGIWYPYIIIGDRIYEFKEDGSLIAVKQKDPKRDLYFYATSKETIDNVSVNKDTLTIHFSNGDYYSIKKFKPRYENTPSSYGDANDALYRFYNSNLVFSFSLHRNGGILKPIKINNISILQLTMPNGDTFRGSFKPNKKDCEYRGLYDGEIHAYNVSDYFILFQELTPWDGTWNRHGVEEIYKDGKRVNL